MFKTKVTVVTEFTEKSNFEICEFIDNVKQSFNNVYIISIENLPMSY